MNTLTAVTRWFSTRPTLNSLSQQDNPSQSNVDNNQQSTTQPIASTSASTIEHQDSLDPRPTLTTTTTTRDRHDNDEGTTTRLLGRTTETTNLDETCTTTADHDRPRQIDSQTLTRSNTLFLSATRSSLPSHVALTTSSSSSPPPYSEQDSSNELGQTTSLKQRQVANEDNNDSIPRVVQDEENGKNEWNLNEDNNMTTKTTKPTKLVNEDPLSVTEKTAEPIITDDKDKEDKIKLWNDDEEETKEAEKRLKLKQQQWKRDRLKKIWPVRLTMSIYLFLRRLLSLLGLPYPKSRVKAISDVGQGQQQHALLASPVATNDDDTTLAVNDDDSTSPDELLIRLRNSTDTTPEDNESSTKTLTPKTTGTGSMTHKLTRTALFLRRSTPLSRSFSTTPISNISQSSSTTMIMINNPMAPPKPPRMTPKTLVLDLDETLIHSTSRPYAPNKRNAGLKVKLVEVVLDGRSTMYTVYKRPWVDFFLRKVSSWYTVIIFTASLPEYADPVIDWLDGGDGRAGMVGGRLFRSDCVHANGAYVKDLTVVDTDLSRVCLVDNSPVSYAINQANGIPIEGWINDPNDECLLDLLPMLDSLRFTNDVRRVLGLRGFR
ncbi:Nuclear envelope morphology protein 1 [Microbotryomycetes sp. JL221]|nr:Nuclear envelope morphology protein 1 [Microbotryomycetes sp. JL221]